MNDYYIAAFPLAAITPRMSRIEKARASRDWMLSSARSWRNDPAMILACVKYAREFNRLLVWNKRAERRLADARGAL